MNTDRFDDLTLRQQSVFGFIVAYKSDHDGNSPSVREMMAACGYHSTGTMHYTLKRLAEVGLIELSAKLGTTRHISVVGGCWKFNEPFKENNRGDAETETRSGPGVGRDSPRGAASHTIGERLTD